ncbi:MAG: multidrug ABC transporter permease, partial [Kiloniellales bacterium]
LLYRICAVNPFTHAVESIRFALYGQFNGEAVVFVLITLGVLLGLAITGYNPARGMMSRKGGDG